MMTSARSLIVNFSLNKLGRAEPVAIVNLGGTKTLEPQLKKLSLRSNGGRKTGALCS